ncbi:transmembrane protein [Arabidopsis thaliana]|uniref:Transmembrane protein n=1 Tax=Arabidopsis thaliana TaxID=3702 RepID=F4K9X6_ARATH|nr:uncharacterized protein AT5G22555 [Arabidopsis thaliana]AED93042.1 transmembrane protein [Arabidopsis thaliana]|eukprot:NP_568421.1 transmembrane protein [Arabidopsis thaliana]
MIGLVLGTIFFGSIPIFIFKRHTNGHEPIPKHKRGGGSTIIAVCLILLLFLTQALGANVCNAADGTCKAGAKSETYAGDEFDPFHEADHYDDGDE